MRFEVAFTDRAYAANLFRRRRDELRDLAEKKSMSAIKQELLAEATYCENVATQYDRGDAGAGNNENEGGPDGRSGNQQG